MNQNVVLTDHHYIQRVHAPESFSWLEKLTPERDGHPSGIASCFGMDMGYLHWDLLAHYPNELVLSVPALQTPPIEYGFACTSKGERWFCYVVVRRNGPRSAALVFEVNPFVLMFAAQGLRDERGNEIPMVPNRAVLAPLDNLPIRHEQLNPDSKQYLCLYEGHQPQVPDATAKQDFMGNLLGAGPPPNQISPLRFDVGSPAFGVPIRINENHALLNMLASLSGGSSSMGGATGMGGQS